MNFKYLLFFSCFFLLACNNGKEQLHKQADYSDSLAYYFKVANDDDVPFQKRFNCNQRAIAILQKSDNDSVMRKNLFKVANRFWNMNAFEDYKIFLEVIIKKSNQAKDIASEAKANIYIGDYYNRKLISDSAYLYYSRSQKLYIKLKDNPQIIRSLFAKAMMQFYAKDFIGCENSAVNALKVINRDNNADNNGTEYEIYNLLGSIDSELQEHDRAMEFYNKALLTLEKGNFDPKYHFKGAILYNIGLVYQNKKEHKKAIVYFQKALLEPNLAIDSPALYINLKTNIGYCKLQLGEYDGLPGLFYSSLKIDDNFKFTFSVLSRKSNLSDYYIAKKDTTTGILFAKEVNKIANEKNVTKYRLKSLQQLSKIDKKNSAVYSSAYYRIDDSLQLAERRMRNKFARIEFETDELITEKEKLTDEKKNMIFIGGILFLVAVIIFVVGSYEKKNRKLEFAQKQQLSNEEIYKLILDQQQKIEEGKQLEKKRISQELHDGIMGRLSSIRLNLFILSRKTDKETIEKCLVHINEIQDVEKEISGIAYDLNENIFSGESNFIAIVNNLFTAIESHTNINFRLNSDDRIDWDIIDNTIKIQVYRIIQEALQNIKKYADAKNVVITITGFPNFMTIEITDDGVGFEEQKIKKGFGLTNMRSRANDIKSKIEITSYPGSGTRIILTIPVNPNLTNPNV